MNVRFLFLRFWMLSLRTMNTFTLFTMLVGARRRLTLIIYHLIQCRWDEWVKDTRIFKDDEEGKRTMEEVAKLV